MLPSLADVSISLAQDSTYLYCGIYSNSSKDGSILLTPHYLRRKEEIFYGKKRLMFFSRWWWFFVVVYFPTPSLWFAWLSFFLDRKGTQDPSAVLPRQSDAATLPFTTSPALPSTRFSAENCFFSTVLPWWTCLACLILATLIFKDTQSFSHHWNL